MAIKVKTVGDKGYLSIDFPADDNPCPMVDPDSPIPSSMTIDITIPKDSCMEGLDHEERQKVLALCFSPAKPVYTLHSVEYPGFAQKEYSDWIAEALDKHIRAVVFKAKLSVLKEKALKAVPSSKRGKRRHRHLLRASHLSKQIRL